jgi:hypothetical protein
MSTVNPFHPWGILPEFATPRPYEKLRMKGIAATVKYSSEYKLSVLSLTTEKT